MLYILLLGLSILLAGYNISRRNAKGPLPPGPRGLPFLGNALHIPPEYSWLTFTRWAQTYGDVMHLSVIGQSFIILSSRKAIDDLLEKRGAMYSDRPIIPMAGELAGFGQYMAMFPYGRRHREGRKLFLGTLNPRNAPRLQAIQEETVAPFVANLAEDPSNFLLHIRWLVASVVLRITHGLTIDSYDDPVIQTMEKVIHDVSKLSAPGAYLVDSLPILMHIPDWFPGAGFKKVAKDARDNSSRIEHKLYGIVKEQVARGTALPSFAGDLMQNNPNATPEEEDLYRKTGTLFYTAGSDTTVSVIESFLILIAQNPGIQKKAQAEVDAVTGRTRPPVFSDREALPYLDAVLKEVFRHKPAGPLALPHKVRQDDHYAGYWIPAGSTVLSNTWAIMRDPSLYPNPDLVDPERYLRDSNENLNPDPRIFAFGYGRRVCPGQMLAESTLFLTAANILASFDVSEAFSLDGSEPKWGGGVVSQPLPFKCTIKPRTKTAHHG
ncbi:cytochrome P450 [Fomitopsis serialis]|uniref:cytochrome P450 n=1 Tax=Fomitopsis serialis TaxID=139415 RepID=UPI00200726BD|nr:cytochrome P450 [Neoantrodia serialis]KAH9927567.1 cytochrome P450 [Neoantrodia serialis]